MTRPDPPYPRYPEWSHDQRYAAQQVLNNALDILDEFDY